MLRKLVAGFISANSSIIHKWGQSWWHSLSHRFRIKKRWPMFASSTLYEAIQRRLQWWGYRLCLILGSFARDLAERQKMTWVYFWVNPLIVPRLPTNELWLGGDDGQIAVSLYVQRTTTNSDKTAPELQLPVFHHVVKKKLSKHLMFQFYPVESKIKFSIRISNPQFSACFLPWRRPLSPAVEILTSKANLFRVLMFFAHLPFLSF